MPPFISPAPPHQVHSYTLALLTISLQHSLDCILDSFCCRLIEEVKEETGVVLESDDVYMSTTFESFIHTLVTKSRGGGVVELEYDAVSVCMLNVNQYRW